MAYKFEASGKRVPVTEKELDTIQDDGSFIIVLDHGNSTDGRAYWLYIAVKASKYKSFRNLVARRATVRFTDYGDIMRYGYERQVPAAVRQEMIDGYGCDDTYMQWLIQDAEKARQEYLKEKEVEENKRIDDIVTMLKKKQ